MDLCPPTVGAVPAAEVSRRRTLRSAAVLLESIAPRQTIRATFSRAPPFSPESGKELTCPFHSCNIPNRGAEAETGKIYASIEEKK